MNVPKSRLNVDHGDRAGLPSACPQSSGLQGAEPISNLERVVFAIGATGETQPN